MTLADPTGMLEQVRKNGEGLGAFNVIGLEHAEAIVSGAERSGRPVMLQLSQNTVTYRGALRPVCSALLEMAKAASVPVVVHLDHAEDEELVDDAVAMGVPSVMYDGARLPFKENVARTRAVVERCRAQGVAVEAELGEVGGKDGAHAPGVRTDPAEARSFVEATQVGSLAVAVGTSHAMRDRSAVVDLDLVERLAAAVPVPLVLHGSSGVDDAGMVDVVRAGITKINVGTRLNQVLTGTVRAVLAADSAVTDPRRYLGPARTAVADEVARVQELLACRQ